MKVIKVELSRELKGIRILTISDKHIGDKNADITHFRAQIERVRTEPDLYCILSGDLMNMATRASKSDIYSEYIPPMEQIKLLVELLEPIAAKVLCVVPGNHELRTYKSEGIDLTEIVCAQLGIHERYSPTTCLLFIKVGDKGAAHHNHPTVYSLYVTHGSGGGRKEGGKVNRLADLSNIVDADIYIHSHTHLPMVFKEGFYRTDNSNNSALFVEKLFVNTAAGMDYGGYADMQGYKPASKETPEICLSGTKRHMTATL